MKIEFNYFIDSLSIISVSSHELQKTGPCVLSINAMEIDIDIKSSFEVLNLVKSITSWVLRNSHSSIRA